MTGGTWRVATGGKTSVLAEIFSCMHVWSKLTKKSRAALLAINADPDADMHPLTRASLTAHGLIDSDGVTRAGALVAKWNQPKEQT